ncbi:MAG: MurR/RpiR family transcriptional regulator [Streptococcaceae bacterium]|jgi:DNA-binding MurR/RpiR family transcriptional regulator|nr:MurR/RpiR family transcriptional regulator [Streptococcaceae bacterium]
MNILLEIRSKQTSLSPNEQKIAEFILANPEKVVSMSTQEIARLSKTSPASVIRFIKAIGVEGVAQLKILLSLSLSKDEKQEDFSELEPKEEVAKIKTKLKLRIDHMTQLINNQLSDETLLEVSKLIKETQVIVIYGFGASFLVAQDIMQKFSRLGKTVICYEHLHQAAIFLNSNNQKKLCIAISDRGKSKDTIQFAQLAKELAIQTVALTGARNSKLAKLTDYLILSATGESFEFRQAATVSLIAQIYAVDLLFYTYVSQNFEESQELVKNSALLIRDLENT